jgi:DNA-binding transcriptional LysR family regulator
VPRRPTFTLEQMRSFVAVAETEHISRAAGSLFLTQAAVTQQLQHFERAIGLRLFERDGRRIRLTDAGRGMADACKAALRAVEVVDESALVMRNLQAGSLHAGASPTCATYYLPALLAEFNRRHPGVKLGMLVETSGDLNRKVAAGTLDCALIEGAPDPNLKCVELARDELVLVARHDHPLSQLRRVTSADLARHRYLGRGPEWSAERTVRQMIGDAYDHVDAMNLGHPEYVRASAIAGLGFAALSKRAVEGDIASGVLTRLPVAPVSRPITAVRRPGAGGPVQEAFWEMLTGGRVLSSGKMPTDGRGKS